MALKKLIQESYQNPKMQQYQDKKSPLEKIRKELQEYISLNRTHGENLNFGKIAKKDPRFSATPRVIPRFKFTQVYDIPGIPGGKIQLEETEVAGWRNTYSNPNIDFYYLEGSPEEDLNFVREIIKRNDLSKKLQ